MNAKADDVREAADKAMPETKPIQLHMHAIPPEWLHTQLPPQDFVVEGYLPANFTCTCFAEGGCGKSSVLLALLTAVACKLESWASLKVRGGAVLYVSVEDNAETIRRRLFWQRAAFVQVMARLVERNQMTNEERVAKLQHYDQMITKKFYLACLRGGQLHIVTLEGGVMVQAPGLDALIEAARRIPNLRLIVLDPASRLHGADENSNSLQTALVNSIEKLAEATGAAVLLVHHISKDASRRRDMTADASRGGKGLTDGTRSALRMALVEQMPKGISLRVAGEDGIFREVPTQAFTDKRVTVIAHVKCNLSKRQRDIYFLRDEDSTVQRPLHLESVADAGYRQRIESLRLWWLQRPLGFVLTREYLRESYKDLDVKMTRAAAMTFMSDAITQGDLVTAPGLKRAKNTHAGYVLAELNRQTAVNRQTAGGLDRQQDRRAALNRRQPLSLDGGGLKTPVSRDRSGVQKQSRGSKPPQTAKVDPIKRHRKRARP